MNFAQVKYNTSHAPSSTWKYYAEASVTLNTHTETATFVPRTVSHILIY